MLRPPRDTSQRDYFDVGVGMDFSRRKDDLASRRFFRIYFDGGASLLLGIKF